MATIYDLPPELFDDILQRIDDIQAYHHLSFVSKSLSKLAEPYLYRKVDACNFIQDGKSEHHELKGQKLRALLRTLVNRPELAEFIKTVVLGAWKNTLFAHEDSASTLHIPPFEDAAVNDLAKLALSCGLLRTSFAPLTFKSQTHKIAVNNDVTRQPDADWDSLDSWDEKWLRSLQHGLDDALVILLVALCSNLEDIYINGVPFEHLSWSALARVPHQFESLWRVSLNGNRGPGEVGFTLRGFASLISAPNLSELNVRGTNDVCWTDEVDRATERLLEQRQLQPCVTNLTKIDLEFCDLSDFSIKNLIGGCEALDTLCCVGGTGYLSVEVFTAQCLRAALSSQKHSLRELRLDIIPCSSRSLAHFGSLAEFAVLAKVVITEECLLDPNDPAGTNLTLILPPSLEILVLLLHLDALCSQPLLGLSRNAAKYPRLSEVRCSCEADPEVPEHLQEHLTEPFEKAGIKLTIFYIDDRDEWNSTEW